MKKSTITMQVSEGIIDKIDKNEKYEVFFIETDENENNIKKPPLGLTPAHLFKGYEERIEDIKAVFNRYMLANKSIPTDWVNEYNYLINLINNKKAFE